jgi:hypothetical protein
MIVIMEMCLSSVTSARIQCSVLLFITTVPGILFIGK